MAASLDVQVRRGLTGGAVLPGAGINKHWDPVYIFNLDNILSTAHITPGTPLLRLFNESSPSTE